MSREIKFRAWHKRKKMYISHGELFAMDCSNEFPFLALIKGFYKDDDMDIILEQYIGLKDKNGKEIYVNDILKVTLENTREIFICLSDYKEFITNSIYSAYHELEVIGNIHENKEMLK